MKPLTFVGGNWTSAEKHRFIAQVTEAPRGIDPIDAVQCPVRGCSDKSVVNQTLRALGFKTTSAVVPSETIGLAFFVLSNF